MCAKTGERTPPLALACVTLPLDVAERIAELAWMYTDLSDSADDRDVSALEVVQAEIAAVKELLNGLERTA